MTQTLTFVPFAPDHLPGALHLSRAAGWPHRAEDWALVLSLSQGLVALEGQRVVATALVTPFGAVGMVNMRDGKPFSVGGFTIRNRRIVEMDILADPERLARLDLTVLED